VDLVDKEVIVFPPCLRSFLVFLVLSKEGEAAETQVWLKFAVKCEYISTKQGRELYSIYNKRIKWIGKND
jgi:hypothetical protein